LANLNDHTVEDPLGSDFRKRYQRRFTQKESPEMPLSKIYEMYGCNPGCIKLIILAPYDAK